MSKPTPTLTFPELAALWCERQAGEPSALRERLKAQTAIYQPVGWLLLQCQMLDSSRLGNLTLVPYGGKSTLQTIPEHPISLCGLASTMSVVIGVMPSEALV